MNCLMYVHLSSSELSLSPSQCLQILAIREYAEKHNLNIIDYLIDRDDITKEARLKSLGRFLDKQKGVKAVITTWQQVATLAEYTALKNILEHKKIGFIIVLGAP